jgi:hypothetical protein
VGAEGDNEEILFRRVLEHYGFGRLTGVRRKYLIRVLKSLHLKGTESADETKAREERSV